MSNWITDMLEHLRNNNATMYNVVKDTANDVNDLRIANMIAGNNETQKIYLEKCGQAWDIFSAICPEETRQLLKNYPLELGSNMKKGKAKNLIVASISGEICRLAKA